MKKIAIVGASGLVGQKIIKILDEENLLKNIDLHLFVSSKSYGRLLIYAGKEYRLLKISDNTFKEKFDVVFFSAGDEVSKLWAKKFADCGAFVIDNSNAFRREKHVPLVVPEINSKLINSKTKIISNPNCTTIQLAVILDRLQKLSQIKKVVVSSYQSVSGAGSDALLDLFNGTKNQIKEGIQNNLIAKIGEIEENGFCVEENKMIFELQKILSNEFEVYATSVRVPIPYCHGESVYVEFSDKLEIDNIKNTLKCDYIILDEGCLSLPTTIADSNKTHICRLRLVDGNKLMFFVVADNLRRGASYNAVLIYKKIIQILENKQKIN